MKLFRVTWTESKAEDVRPSRLVDFLNSLYENKNRESSPVAEVICGECKKQLTDLVNVSTMPNADDLLLQPIGYVFCPYCGAKLDEEYH